MTTYSPRTGRYAVICCKLKQNANEYCNNASLAGLVLCVIACFILLVIAPLVKALLQSIGLLWCIRQGNATADDTMPEI